MSMTWTELIARANLSRTTSLMSRWQPFASAVFLPRLRSVVYYVVYYVVFIMLVGCTACMAEPWVHQGFAEFVKGTFDDAGSNLYVNADGVIEIINCWDINSDGHTDLFLANNHDVVERGPTRVYEVDKSKSTGWKYRELPNTSGSAAKIIDLDADGHNDLIVLNDFNGVSSELPCFVYWGEKNGLSAKAVELPALGARAVALIDLDRNGLLDLILPSAWKDPHNPAVPMNAKVYLQKKGRYFDEATEKYAITCVGALGVDEADLNKDGFVDLVVVNSREGHQAETNSFIYWGTKSGLNTTRPQNLPTTAASRVLIADLNSDSYPEILITEGDATKIYWNQNGTISPNDTSRVDGIAPVVAEVSGDGQLELLTITPAGVHVRSLNDLAALKDVVPLKSAIHVSACDLDGDKLPELVVSRHEAEGLYATNSVVFWNSHEGFSHSRTSLVATSGAAGNALGDLNGDGKPEVVFTNTAGGHSTQCIDSFVYLGDEHGRFSPSRRIELPTAGTSRCLAADLNRDGHNDLAFNTTAVYPGGAGKLGGIRIFWGGTDSIRPDRYLDLIASNCEKFNLRCADFNKDGYLDLLSVGAPQEVYVMGATGANSDKKKAESSTIFWGSKKGFSPNNTSHVENYGYCGAVADVNRDGHLDLLFEDFRGYVRIYPGSDKGFSKDTMIRLPCDAMGQGALITTADINKDGWLDIVLGMLSARLRLPDTVHIFYGGADGYDPKRKQSYYGNYGSAGVGIADYDNDGDLDIMTSAYLSATSRVLPAQLFLGNGKTIDFENPQDLFAEGSTAVLQMDYNRDGWVDALVVCHRNDAGHVVNSRLYWNGPKGFSEDRVTLLPGLGPHGSTSRGFGNAYNREPWEEYVSPPYATHGRQATSISWRAEIPVDAALKFQLRCANTVKELRNVKWIGPHGANSFYDKPGAQVKGLPQGAAFIQYKARFVYPTGCRSPKLRQVRVDFTP